MIKTMILVATVDGRGSISDILHRTPIQHVSIVETRPSPGQSVIRGNHYHCETTQYLFLTKGALRYWWTPADRSAPVQSIWVTPYDLITTPPFEIHALEFHCPAQFLVFTDGTRGGPDYELDTVRVEPILTPEILGRMR